MPRKNRADVCDGIRAGCEGDRSRRRANHGLDDVVDVIDRSLQAVDTGRLTLVPRNWEAQATGGPTVATIDGTGAKVPKAAF